MLESKSLHLGIETQSSIESFNEVQRASVTLPGNFMPTLSHCSNISDDLSASDTPHLSPRVSKGINRHNVMWYRKGRAVPRKEFKMRLLAASDMMRDLVRD